MDGYFKRGTAHRQIRRPDAWAVLRVGKFVKAGEEYVEHLALSEETISSLEMPMLPNDIYIQIMNHQSAVGIRKTLKTC